VHTAPTPGLHPCLLIQWATQGSTWHMAEGGALHGIAHFVRGLFSKALFTAMVWDQSIWRPTQASVSGSLPAATEHMRCAEPRPGCTAHVMFRQPPTLASTCGLPSILIATAYLASTHFLNALISPYLPALICCAAGKYTASGTRPSISLPGVGEGPGCAE
jgi:hypothetical protein